MYVSNIPAAVVSFDLLAVMYTIALFRFRLFDLVPVARETIVRRMPNAMLVLDVHDRVADMNDAAARLLDLHVGDALRRPVAEVLGRFPGLVERIALARATPAATATLDAHVGPRTCEVTSTPLTDWQGLSIGRLVLLHETTTLRRVEAQLVERERALAAAQEREWVARELHDGLAQDLWLAKLKIGRLAGLPGLRPDATALAAEVGAAVDAGLAEARQAVATMRVGGPESGTLKELLARSLDDFGDQFGLRVDFECDGPLPALSPRAEAEALRIAQEALTNVRRHADATTVTVDAGSEDGRLVLTIRDNGRGFDPSIVGDAAYGMASMRERASLIGGALAIESAPRQGTSVRLTIPLATASPVAAGVA
jgi:signal transduction histidine kinase